MNELVLVVPKAGVKVRDPETKLHLNEAGEQKLKSIYWLRREKEGDVVLKPIENKKLTTK